MRAAVGEVQRAGLDGARRMLFERGQVAALFRENEPENAILTLDICR